MKPQSWAVWPRSRPDFLFMSCGASFEGVEAEVPPLKVDHKSCRFFVQPFIRIRTRDSRSLSTLEHKSELCLVDVNCLVTECCNDARSPPILMEPLMDSSETTESQKRNGWLLFLLCLLLATGPPSPCHLFHR